MKKYLLILSIAVLSSACASRTIKIVDATWASMKNPMPPNSKEKLTKVANVAEEFCLSAWNGSYGLMDEAVKQAELKHQLDYIKYPSFTMSQGKSCVQVSGEGYRVTR
ncbi:MAG: hypothetical protein ACXWC9_07390 [Pseudobdellovibrionaceae bacterium]